MMIRNRYRNVCNPHRDRQMALAKIAGTFAKGIGLIDPGWAGYELMPLRQRVRLKPLAFGLLLALGAPLLGVPLADAQIVAYRNAPATQQATILNAANGIPLVNIQTPSAAGVSRNSYSQFDVQQPGAILNNSPTNAQTQLGGWVQGNPWLAGGSARVILNEIFSANPSQLLGYVEVAGNSAQVIIANPAGITCKGCGFINASRATLTTGTPIFNNGNLDGYRVEGGSIRIEGAGMDTSRAGHTDLIARAVEVNAGLWANSLRITTGSNRVDAEHTLATPIAASASATTPAFAIDVAQLGGMYAGKIILVGTEAGVGVRNAGHIGASAGEVVITADGRLLNSGRIGSVAQTQINASRGIDNSGTVYAQGDAVLTTRGHIDNSGVIAAQGNTALSASGAGSRISGTAASVLAAGINLDGSFGNNARLDVSASENVALHGQNLSTGDQFITGSTLDLSDIKGSSRNLTLTVANGSLDARRAILAATGTLSATAAQSLLLDNASSSAQQVQLTAHDMSNVHGELVQTGSSDTAIALAGTLNNTQGRLASNGRNFILSAQGIDNTEGSIVHAGDGSLGIHTNTFTSTRGSLGSNGLLDLVASTFMLDAGSAVARLIRIDVATLSSRGGEIAQTGTGNTLINVSGAYLNDNGTLTSKGHTSLTLGRLENRGGTLSASGGANLTLNASGLLENAGGFIGADGEVQLAAQAIGNHQGRITAGQSLQATTSQGIDNTQGLLAANGNLDLHSASLDNTLGTIGSVHGKVMADAGTGRLANPAGRIEAAQDITLAGTGLSNTDGVITGQNLRLDSRSQSLDNSRGTLASAGTLELHSGTLSNDVGLIQAIGALTINTHGQTLSNTNSGAGGGILGQSTVTLTTGDLANVAGIIGAKGVLDISSSAIANTAGASLSSEQDIRINGTSLDNRGGQIQALGSTGLQIGATVDNTSSLIRSGQTLDMTAGRIINSTTHGINQGIEGRSVNLGASEIDNSNGALRASQTLTLTSGGTINNSGGLISSAQTLQIVDPQAAPTSNSASKTLAVSNSGGLLIADQLLSLDSASLSGDGSVLGQGNLSIKLISDFTNTGQFAANGNAALETTGTLTNRARMQAGNSLRLRAATLNNETSGEIVAGTLHLNATAAHTLTNRGLIDGQDTFIDTPTLNNLGSGRIYGDHVAIAATTLNNDADHSVAPVIAARTRLDIGAQTINNREHALLFSAGDLAIGGALDVNHQATGQAGSLDNISASIEALGTLSIDVGTLNNKRSTFGVRRDFLDTQTAYSQRCDNPPSCTYISYITDQTTRYQDIVTSAATAASIRVGGHTSLNATNLVNEYSSIEAGGNFNLTGSTLTNQGAELYLQTDLVHSEHLIHWGDRDHGTTITASSSSALTGTVPAIISAGGTLTGTYTGRIDNLTLRQNTAPITTPSGTTILALNTGSVSQGATAANAASTAIGNGQTMSLLTQVNAVSANSGSGPATVIRTVTPSTTLPDNSLFLSNPSPTGHYLIETDPRFAGYRQWLTSDYLLQALALDPDTLQKRLGDGFYEQRLINEQVAQLTGRRYLTNYQNDEAQYRALMDAGVTYAQAWNLIPGIALSAEQMAALTTDIVWLVEKDVTLTNGQTSKALVPQVYARLRDGDLTPSGALLAGNDIQFSLAGDLTNSGNIAGRQIVALTAENIRNLGGRISGQEALLAARSDLSSIGGVIEAQDRLLVTAGHDLTLASRSVDLDDRQNGSVNTVKRTVIDRVAGLYVTNPGGTLVASAGNDMRLLAARISNAAADGRTTLIAGNDLELGSVRETSLANTAGKQTRRSEARSTEVGSTLQTGGDLRLEAGNDLNARAASVTSSEGALTVRAGHDINIDAGEATHDMDYQRKSTKSGFLSSTTKVRRDTLSETTTLASTFSGDTTTLLAGNDLRIKGSNVVATRDTTLIAGHNLSIEAASETFNETHFRSEKTSGLFTSGGAGFTIGSKQMSTDQKTWGSAAFASTIGSTEGNVIMQAGNAYRQVGSDVITPQGSIDIRAKTLDIVEARETRSSVFESKAKQSGLSIAITSPIITAVQTAQQMSQAAGDTKDSRMQVLAAASSALSAKNALDAIKTGQGTTIDGKANQMPVVDDAGMVIGSRDATAAEQIGGVNLSISIGSSKSSSKTTQSSDSAAGSNLIAGQDIRLTASGAGPDSDLTVQGSHLAAVNNVTLKADDEIRLLAAVNTATQHSTSKSSSASVGFSIGSDGLLFNVGASGGRGRADGSDTTWSNSRVEAGQILTLEAGGDTTLRGAVASGQQVIAKVGTAGRGKLLIESLQDSSNYNSKQQSAGFSLSVGPGKMSGSVSASQSKVNSDFASVAEQSGLKAGDGGFQVEVKGDTDLKGAVIASTQSAVDNNKNTFSTDGTLTLSDIQNRASYSARSTSINLGSGVSFDGKLIPGGTSAGFGQDSGKAGSTTLAGISGMAGNTAVRSGDAEIGIKPIFDPQKVQKDIDAQVKITQQFGQLASKAVGDYAAGKLKEAGDLRTQANKEKETNPDYARQLENQAITLESQWGDQGSLRIAAHTLIGGLTGGASGAAGAAAGTLTAPIVAQKLSEAGIEGGLATTLTALASTTVGAVVGGTVGAGTAFNEVTNNFLAHDEAAKREAAKQKLFSCKGDDCVRAAADVNYWNEVDAWRDTQIDTACRNSASPICQGWNAAIQYAKVSYVGFDDRSIDSTGSMAAERSQVNTQASKYQQAVSNPYLFGVGKGLLKLTPPGLVAGVGVGTYELTTAIINNGFTDTAIAIAKGIVNLPDNLRAGLNSSDPNVSGEALVDALALGSVATAVTGKLVQSGVSFVKAGANTGSVVSESQVLAKFAENSANQSYRSLDLTINERGLLALERHLADAASWKRADGSIWWPPYDGAIPGTQRIISLEPGVGGYVNLVDRYGKTSGTYVSPAGLSLESRALSSTPTTSPSIYSIDASVGGVERSTIAPWFGQTGLGVQYKLPNSVQYYLDTLKIGVPK